jgi:SAM-dependent methyltransferase
MEKVTACGLCRGDKFRILYRFSDFSIQQCQSCGLVCRDRLLSEQDSKELYDVGYFNSQQARYFSHRHVAFYKKIQMVESFCKQPLFTPKRKLLDVGCAVGTFLQIAGERGWEVYGQDVSVYAANVSRAKKLDIFTGDLWDAHFPNDFFDVITAWDSLNHANDPQRLLREMNRILKKGGLLAVEVNSIDSFMYRLAHWLYIGTHGIVHWPAQRGYPIHQSTFYDKRTLQQAFAAAQFKVLSSRRTPFSSREASLSAESIFAKCMFYSVNAIGNLLKRPVSIVIYARKL